MPFARSSQTAGSRPKKLRNRLILSFAFVTSSLMIFTIVFVGMKQKAISIQQAQDRGLAIAENIAGMSMSYLLAYDYVSLTQAAENARKRKGIKYVIILDKEERVAAYSGHPEKQGERISDSLNTKALKAESPLIIQTKYKGERVLNITVPVFLEKSKEKWGTVRVGLSLEKIYKDILKTRLALLFIGILALGGVIGISVVLARRITKPVEKLVDATISASMGVLDHDLDVRTGDEIEHLAKSFNEMMKRISSQRLEIEDRLREITSLKKYNDLVLESMESGLITVDFKGKVTLINSAGKNILGIGTLQHYTELGEGLAELKKVVKQALAEQRSVSNMELQVKTKSGERILDVNSSVIKDENNLAVGVLVVFHDFTELKELQGKLQRADRLSAVGTVASGLAHDIKNPLSAIRTFTQLLPLKKDSRDFLDQFNLTVPRELERINRTLENLLELSRKPRMNFENLRSHRLLDQVIDVYSNEIAQNGIKVCKQHYGEDLMIKGDAEYLHRVFSNLIINAVQAMPDGGALYLSTGKVDDMVTVEIKDTGCGMDEETAMNAFNPYFSTKRKGSGLGLSIAQKIVEEHNGEISMESKAGKGTTFRVLIPSIIVSV